MMILFALFGLVVGWGINQLSTYFPRGTARQPDSHWCKLHILSEVGSAAFMSYLWLRFEFSWLLLPYGMMYSFFALITIIDIKCRLVPNALIYPAVIVVLVAQALLGYHHALPIVLGGAFGFLIFYGAASIRPNGLGGGDIKLAALIGFVFGFPDILYALLLGAGASGVFIAALFMTRRGDLQTQIPYAPFLCFGALAALMLNPVGVEGWVLL